jgi:hypothetical protein
VVSYRLYGAVELCVVEKGLSCEVPVYHAVIPVYGVVCRSRMLQNL